MKAKYLGQAGLGMVTGKVYEIQDAGIIQGSSCYNVIDDDGDLRVLPKTNFKTVFSVKYICITTFVGITFNKIYEAVEEQGGYAFIDDDGNPRNFLKDKFEIVNETLKGECLNNDMVEYALTVGKIYDLIQCDRYEENYSVFTDDNKKDTFKKDRFKLLKETVTKPRLKAPVSSDIDEDRCWAALRPTIPQGFCICGIMKADCRYHS